MQLARPGCLKAGDRIAIVSPSWGGPAALPAYYALGRQTLEERLGLEVVEMPHALADADWLARHPEGRAADLHAAFKDPSIRAIIASIGGDDSIRLMPHLDLRIIADNAKIFVGFSDATSIHFACMKAGLTSFYGPNVMPNLAAQHHPFDYAIEMFRRTFFDAHPLGLIEPNNGSWTAQLFDLFASKEEHSSSLLHHSSGPRLLQGRGKARGPLIGGCAEVLEQLKATAWWPSLDAWRGAIMFYETYDATPTQVTAWLRNYAAQGILQVLSGFIFGRPGAVLPELQGDFDAALVHVLEENSLGHLPLMTNMDFGHTDPVFTLPYGVVAEINCDAGTFTVTESCVKDE